MGLLSKLWKGIKKTVKKIGKGIKKVFKKIGGAIGKLGVVGQIGMSFLMPYAVGALGSAFGATGKLATWSSKLLNKSGVGAKALGHTVNLINKAGTFTGNIYSSVSETIGNAVDRVTNFAKGKGFTLSEGRNSIFAKDVPAPTKVTPTISSEKDFKIDMDALTKDVDIQTKLKKTIPDALGVESETNKSLLSFDNTKVDVISDISSDKTLLDTVKSIPNQVAEGIKSFDIKEAVSTGLQESVVGGVKATGTQMIAKGLGYETPEGPSSYYINLPDMAELSMSSPSVYNEVDLSLQKQGNNYWTSNFQNTNYLNSALGEGTSQYDAYMANFAASQFTNRF